MKIYDCFMYYDEDQLLDLRLNILNEYVDKFVITESKFTHSGKVKERNFNIRNFTKFKDKIKYFYIEKEPDNILAWHLKGISHNRLGETILANLSAAEEYLRRRDLETAKYFASKVIKTSKKFSSENLRASDIINLINEFNKG